MLRALAGCAAAAGVAASTVLINTSEPFSVRSACCELGAGGKIRGASGSLHAARARALGADAVRTWNVSELARVIPEAEQLGLRVSAGIWLSQDPARYAECANINADVQWQIDLSQILASVGAHKQSPALLWWTVGNEVELAVDRDVGNECIWRRIEWVAQAVRREDGDHPVGTALAGVSQAKIASILTWCPSLTFLGVNAFGPAPSGIGPFLRGEGWDKAFVLTEFGPVHPSLAPATSWGAGLEPTSVQRRRAYVDSYNACKQDTHCVGSFAHLWGWQWHGTGTWLSLFNSWPQASTACPACESEVVGALAALWAGTEPNATTVLSVAAVKASGIPLPVGQLSVDEGARVELEVDTFSERGDLVVTWALTVDSPQIVPPLIPGAWGAGLGTTASGHSVTLITASLSLSLPYRVHVFVREAGGTREGHASVALHQCRTTTPGEPCYAAVQQSLAQGGNASFEEAQASLHARRQANCTLPCRFYACHTAVEGEQCYGAVLWAMQTGFWANPSWYPGISSSSSFEQFQSLLNQQDISGCPVPCSAPMPSTTATTTASTREPCCCVADPGTLCYADIIWAQRVGIYSNPEWYPGVTAGSSFEEFQESMFLSGSSGCQHPCTPMTSTTSSSTSSGTTSTVTPTPDPDCLWVAVSGDGCWEEVRWAMQQGIIDHPEWYPGLNASDSWVRFQIYFHDLWVRGGTTTNCPHPCMDVDCPFVAQEGDPCYLLVEWVRDLDIRQRPERYPGLNATTSTFKDLQAFLFQQGNPLCPSPCTSTTTTTTTRCCCVAGRADECYRAVLWAMQTGIYMNPNWYPGLDNTSAFKAFQLVLHNRQEANCQDPCPDTEATSRAPLLAPRLAWAGLALAAVAGAASR